ncbi:nitroreductase family protein [Bifidobacterium sp. CP2]|uniref:nitroreductase family protein n=1 Tax=Bifidobacterium TaxID=1678 RepID=UPI001BDD7FAF|nr:MULTISPECIES: nitroreductase family protein [Bifidobacterium]MBT1180603.1 nitroreductase family protein [Bifidobacterium sp. CP2]MBW3080448.1 nitroreductase family protein [Bifidobacterium saguinibicoloris]
MTASAIPFPPESAGADPARNATLGILESRRTIRKFAEEPIDQETIDAIEQAARQTATSESLSSWSVIRVKDPKLRELVASICGHARIARAPLLYIFLADQHRNLRIAEEKGVDTAGGVLSSTHLFLQAYDDAVLAVHATETAAESLGLGAVILGAISRGVPQLVEALHLPKHVFPVLGLAIGKPVKVPELKPRPPIAFQYFDDVYPSDGDTPDLVGALADFDKDVHDYYERRNPDNPLTGFTDYVAGLATRTTDVKLFEQIREQGFTE